VSQRDLLAQEYIFFHMNKQSGISRRQVIRGLGTGLVAAAAPRVFAVEGESQQESTLKAELQDPTTKYPKPPFNSQSQPWPGLASKMDPPRIMVRRVIRGWRRVRPG
jgi:hypothetical protein